MSRGIKKGSAPAVRKLERSVRQIEIAKLLVIANNLTAGYVEALVLGTSRDRVAQPQPDKPKARAGLTAEQIGKLETEMESLERDLKSVEGSYGENMLDPTCAPRLHPKAAGRCEGGQVSQRQPPRYFAGV